MGRFDEACFALEAATGGKNTLIVDDTGMPSVMVRIPAFRWSDVMEDGDDRLCSAFIVNGVEKDCVFISKFLNVIEDGRAYSLPGRDPTHTLTIDDARKACSRKGPGWHLMSNAEWMAIAHWCRANGQMPHGNNKFGKDARHPHERAVLSPDNSTEITSEGRTLTGTGPDSWTHDGTLSGIHDLNGNVWDYVSGLRIKDGELQVIPDNNSAAGVDESGNSPEWKAIDINGNLVTPGSPDTYKYDGTTRGNDEEPSARITGGVKLSTDLTHPHYTGEDTGGDHAYTIMPFNCLEAEWGLIPHKILKELGLYPVQPAAGEETLFVRNYGERTALRGGSWFDGATAGLWELYMRESRDFLFPDVGFRSAFVVI